MVNVPASFHWLKKSLCHHLVYSDGSALFCDGVVGRCLEVPCYPIKSQWYFIELALDVAVHTFKGSPVHNAFASDVESVFLQENH